MLLVARIVLGCACGLLLAVRETRKGSLTRPGGAAAFFVGALHVAAGLVPASLLLFFFFSSTKLTRRGSDRKARLAGGSAAAHGPQRGRGAIQVQLSADHVYRVCLDQTRRAMRAKHDEQSCVRCPTSLSVKYAATGREWDGMQVL